MMLELDSSSVHKMLDTLGLRLEDALGSGATSIIFPKDDRVLRLTIGDVTQLFLVRAAEQSGLAVPKVFHNYGIVGLYVDEEDELGNCDFEMLECERLDELEHWPKQCDLVWDWYTHIDKHTHGGGILGSRDEIETLRTLAIRDGARFGLSQSLVNAFVFAVDLAKQRNYTIDIDLGLTNCMVRPDTGEILLTDPLHD